MSASAQDIYLLSDATGETGRSGLLVQTPPPDVMSWLPLDGTALPLSVVVLAVARQKARAGIVSPSAGGRDRLAAAFRQRPCSGDVVQESDSASEGPR